MTLLSTGGSSPRLALALNSSTAKQGAVMLTLVCRPVAPVRGHVHPPVSLSLCLALRWVLGTQRSQVQLRPSDCFCLEWGGGRAQGAGKHRQVGD